MQQTPRKIPKENANNHTQIKTTQIYNAINKTLQTQGNNQTAKQNQARNTKRRANKQVNRNTNNENNQSA